MILTSEIIERIKSEIDIVGFIESYGVELKKVGSCYKAYCPFHDDKIASFVVYPATQSWYCFGGCGGGDVVEFLMKIDGITFKEAIEQLG